MFHELMLRDHEDGRAAGSTIGECGLKVLSKAREIKRTSGKIGTVKFHIINLVKNPTSKIQNRSRGISERYVAG